MDVSISKECLPDYKSLCLPLEECTYSGTDLVFIMVDNEGDNMKKIIISLLMAFATTFASAYISGIAIQTDNASDIQVYINGKLYNKTPEKFVRIKSTPGLFHVQVKVLNPYDKNWYLVRKDIRVENGYEFFYKMVFQKGKRPTIQAIKRYPVYSKYFLNPMLYNRHPIS